MTFYLYFVRKFYGLIGLYIKEKGRGRKREIEKEIYGEY